jgi:hypothetical protein
MTSSLKYIPREVTTALSLKKFFKGLCKNRNLRAGGVTQAVERLA